MISFFWWIFWRKKEQETETQCENGSVEERKSCRLCKQSTLVIGIGTRYVSSLVMIYSTVYDIRLRIGEILYYDYYYITQYTLVAMFAAKRE